MNTYETCMAKSARVAWSLEQDVMNLQFNFDNYFLPISLRGDVYLEQPSNHSLLFDHIKLYSYCSLFHFLESLIIQYNITQSPQVASYDQSALQSMLLFSSEEIKHQKMFEHVQQKINDHYQTALSTIENTNEIIQSLLSTFHPVSILLLIYMTEWLTQYHYLQFFADKNNTGDPHMAKIFKLHWIEEAQHTQLDYLELKRQMETASTTEKQTVIADFVQILKQFDQLLMMQSHIDLGNISSILKQAFSAQEKQKVYDSWLSNYRDIIIKSGLEHQRFMKCCQNVFSEVAIDFSDISKQVLG